MNWRLLGCALLAAGAFIGLGLLALNMAIGRVGCPSTVVWDGRAYGAVGTATVDPVVGDEVERRERGAAEDRHGVNDRLVKLLGASALQVFGTKRADEPERLIDLHVIRPLLRV